MTGITIEHAQIVRWAQNRGGQPALDTSCNRPVIKFPEDGGENIISWDQWLSTFDRDQWAFIYQDRTPDNERSRSWNTVRRFNSVSEGVAALATA